MPKEITHWIIAREAFLSLEDTSPLKKAILKTPNLYNCAAVILDTPYYSFGKKGQPLHRAADLFHNSLNNSFSPFHQILLNSPLLSFEAELCTLAGMITHIITDATFHPMICFLSGKESGPSKQKGTAAHRKFETSLDLFFLKNLPPANEPLLRQYVADLEVDKYNLSQFLSQLFGLYNSSDQALLARSIQEHCLFQRLFNKSWPVWLLSFVNLFLPHRVDVLLALSYVFVKKNATPLDNTTISYRHPVTGDNYNKSLNELKSEALDSINNIFTKLERCCTRDKLLKLFQQQGPNLVTGLTDSTNNKMHYFTDNPFQ